MWEGGPCLVGIVQCGKVNSPPCISICWLMLFVFDCICFALNSLQSALYVHTVSRHSQIGTRRNESSHDETNQFDIEIILYTFANINSNIETHWTVIKFFWRNEFSTLTLHCCWLLCSCVSSPLPCIFNWILKLFSNFFTFTFSCFWKINENIYRFSISLGNCGFRWIVEMKSNHFMVLVGIGKWLTL